MKKTPLQIVKERFESKEKLVEAVSKLTQDESLFLDRLNDEKGLEKVSNAKLLKLHDVLTSVKESFGSRDKLIGAILELEKRAKDEGYKSRLESKPTPALLDMHTSAARRAKKAEGKPAPAKQKKKPRSKKAQAKAKAAKK